MHVVLISVGTDGDIFPYAGVGAELRSRGHGVTLAACESYLPLAKQNDFEFVSLVSTRENDALFGHPDFWNPRKTAFLCARWGVRLLRRHYDLLSSVLRRDSVIVANPGVLAALLVHEKHGVPWTNLILQPWMIPSALAPPRLPGLPFVSRTPRLVWKMFFHAVNLFGDVVIGREFNALRAELGLKPMRRILSNWFSRELLIGMFPDWFGAPQADWPPQLNLVGFPVVDGGRARELPQELVSFCQAGEPPIAFTYGTGMAHSAAMFRAAIEACALLGRRGILLTKFRDQLPSLLPASVMHCEYASFTKLFPQCAAVVHHGGIGTVAQALAAGVPQLACHICFDQLDNADRIKRMGAGDCLPARASGKQIAKALAPLLAGEARTTARRWRMQIDGKAALDAAASLVESLANKTA